VGGIDGGRDDNRNRRDNADCMGEDAMKAKKKRCICGWLAQVDMWNSKGVSMFCPECGVFDPPHILRKSATGIISKKYGKLRPEWKNDVRKGFEECFRVLRPGGFLNFKWSEVEISLSDVTPLFPQRPMYYQRQGISGAWFMFRK